MIKAICYCDGSLNDYRKLTYIIDEQFGLTDSFIKDNKVTFVKILSAADGESQLYWEAQAVEQSTADSILLTNSTFLLNFDRFTWDDEKQVFKVWFWNEHLREFRHINDLTQKDLRRAHNIVKLYQNGALDVMPKWRNYEQS